LSIFLKKTTLFQRTDEYFAGDKWENKWPEGSLS